MTSAPVPDQILALSPDRASGRVDWIDRLRGLAVALMVLDHVLVQLAPGHLVRYTLTRLSLPLFMICAGMVWKPATWRRWAVLALAAWAEWVLFFALGMGHPGIVSLFALVVLVLDVLGEAAFDRWAPHLLVLGLLQALYLPIGWRGYEPGLVLAWFALGWLVGYRFRGVGSRVPAGFASIGRRPLVWYVGHLAALVPLALVAP